MRRLSMVNRFTRRGRDRRGMTLVELLLVMAILSIVTLALMSLYIPTYQSTVAQTQVSDVQDNLRLALKVMTRDILHAGFLVPVDPVTSNDASGFTIRTRIVGNDFARVTGTANLTGKIRITVADPDMVDNFQVGSRVRLFEPINANEVTEQPVVAGITDDERTYPVDAKGTNTIDIDTTNNPSLDAADILPETVMLVVRDQNQPPLQTIQYRLNNDSLERIVNGNLQALARNVDMNPTNSRFDYGLNTDGRLVRIDIQLAGKTVALKNDAISGEKIRSVETSVKMRNVF
jgi:prepilin-type N-terminal cleavage/methylation domain-containing protein